MQNQSPTQTNDIKNIKNNDTQASTSLWELFLTFASFGLFTIGGGAVMLPLIQKTVTQNKKWLDDDEFADMLALTNSAPGAFTINAAIYIGFLRRGLAGSTSAMLGMVTPSVVIILILAYIILMGRNIIWLQQFFDGVRPIVAALLLDDALRLRKTMVKTRFDFALLFLGLIMLVLASVNTVLVIFTGAVLALLYPRIMAHSHSTDTPQEQQASTTEEVRK